MATNDVLWLQNTVVGTSSFVAPYHLASPFMVMRSFILGPLDIGMMVIWPFTVGTMVIWPFTISTMVVWPLNVICPWPTPSLDVCVCLKPTAV